LIGTRLSSGRSQGTGMAGEPCELERHRQTKETFRHRYEVAYASGSTYAGLAQRWREVVEFPLVSSATPPGLVLDAGCGDCTLTRFLCTPSRRIIGLDFSCHALQAARKWFHGASDETIPELMRGDIDRLPFRDGCFDGTVCVGTLEYFSDLRAVLAELGRVSRRGARLVFTVRNRRRVIGATRHGVESPGNVSPLFAFHDVKQVKKAVEEAGGRNPRILPYFAISPAGLAGLLAALPGPLQRAGFRVLCLLERMATATRAGLLISRVLLVSYTVT